MANFPHTLQGKGDSCNENFQKDPTAELSTPKEIPSTTVEKAATSQAESPQRLPFTFKIIGFSFFFFLYAFLFPLSNLGFLTYLDQKSCRLFFFSPPPSDNLVICLQINCKRFTVHLKAKRIHISQLPPPFQTHDHPSIYTVTVQSLCTTQETSYVYKAMHQLVPHKVITAQRSL